MLDRATSNRVAPYWQEIKTWSREDRSYLAELLAISFREDEEAQGAESFVKAMPIEALKMASEYAIRESSAGRGVPHMQAMDLIQERMKWK